jgi:hypothetical protein
MKGDTVINERKLYNGVTLKLTVHESTYHKLLKHIGFWVVKLGLKIVGIGKIVFEDNEA